MPTQYAWCRRVGQVTNSMSLQVNFARVRTASKGPPEASAEAATRPGQLVIWSNLCPSKFTKEHSHVLLRAAQLIQRPCLSWWPAFLMVGL